jgi:hypothetical protein
MTQRLRVIVTGLIAQHPLLGGVAWGVLNWIIGLMRLGHDVYYIEDSGQWPYKWPSNMDVDPSSKDWVARDCTPNVEHLSRVASRFGFADKWAYHFPIRGEWYGLPESKRQKILRSADFLLNVSGTLEYPEHYRCVPRLVYIDTDPVFTQIEVVQGETPLLKQKIDAHDLHDQIEVVQGETPLLKQKIDAHDLHDAAAAIKATYQAQLLKKRVDVHDLHFSFGECLSAPVPVTGHNWQTSVQPRNVFTTVMNWTSYRPLSYGGQTYGQKDAEFVKFLELPSRVTPSVLEVALPKFHHAQWATGCTDLPRTISALMQKHPGWTPHELLARCGWSVVDALDVGSDVESYRQYIQSSKAEWSIAKNGYVRGNAGWFSNRSATYLAAGRPVVVQDTGFAPVLPVGEGILSFRNLEEAVAAIQDVESNYTKHARAAEDIAAAYFDSDKVLSRLINQVFSGHD